MMILLKVGRAKISIHPPRVGRDQIDLFDDPYEIVFQSTLPVWGGTSCTSSISTPQFISIHPPRVGRDRGGVQQYWLQLISIPPPRVGRDS